MQTISYQPAVSASKATYTVAYESDGRWIRSRPFEGLKAARAHRDALVAGDCPAYVAQTHWWDSIGLPEGLAPDWDYTNNRWRI